MRPGNRSGLNVAMLPQLPLGRARPRCGLGAGLFG